MRMDPLYSEGQFSVSPFVFAFYLQFLCYHGLRQYENRDRALRQLMETLDSRDHSGCDCIRFVGFDIAGHCLAFLGRNVLASEMFKKSAELKRNRLRHRGEIDENV